MAVVCEIFVAIVVLIVSCAVVVAGWLVGESTDDKPAVAKMLVGVSVCATDEANEPAEADSDEATAVVAKSVAVGTPVVDIEGDVDSVV
jgi:hypothetical protein